MARISFFLRDQKGIATVEYALLIAFVGLAIAAAMVLLGGAVSGRIDSTTDQLND
jgi:Flp pilus assembly pilin Flp